MRQFHFRKNILSENDIFQKLDEMEKWRRRTIQSLREGKRTSCDGCPNLQDGIYEKEPHVNFLLVVAGDTICNAGCVYCNQYHSIRRHREQGMSYYDLYRIGAKYYKNKIEHITLASGEPTLIPDLNDVMELSAKMGWSVAFHTNGVVYSERVAAVISENHDSFINVSLDCGTRETFKRVKKVDEFEKVVSNLRKYAEQGCKIELKYILLPGYNDSMEDINGFLQIANDLQVRRVVLSQNLMGIIDGHTEAQGGNLDMSESTFAVYAYMIARIQEIGLSWDFQIEFISAHDYARIEKLRR